MPLKPLEAVRLIRRLSPKAIVELNKLARESLQTRGGRAGSGLGSLLEALWGFFVNSELKTDAKGAGIELAWFPDHAYNDFACVFADAAWDPATKKGELLRIETKSMYLAADESKAHFDALLSELDEHDVLVVLVWDWLPVPGESKHPRVAPTVVGSFVGSAVEIARFRDALHLARGGSFVQSPCPDGKGHACSHIGEPLNADGKRERRTGPESRKPASASYAANFGGLVRMLKTNSVVARDAFREWRAKSDDVHDFVCFMHQQYPREEMNQYLLDEWRHCAKTLGLGNYERLSREKLYRRVAEESGFRETLRALRS